MTPRDDAHLVETKLDSTDVFTGKMLRVKRDRIRQPDGGESTREYIVHPGAAIVVATLHDGRLVLERQFCYPVGRVMLEFPAGKIDPGEVSLTTARRELIEEVGYQAKNLKQIGVIHPQIGYSTEIIDVFEATGLTHVGAQLDAGEFLDVVLMTEAELLAAFDRGELTDGKSIAALFMWLRRR